MVEVSTQEEVSLRAAEALKRLQQIENLSPPRN
jgi:hypothetical protein